MIICRVLYRLGVLVHENDGDVPVSDENHRSEVRTCARARSHTHTRASACVCDVQWWRSKTRVTTTICVCVCEWVCVCVWRTGVHRDQILGRLLRRVRFPIEAQIQDVKILKSKYVLLLYSKCTKALIFENCFCGRKKEAMTAEECYNQTQTYMCPGPLHGACKICKF
jgi:hypothetical protein